MKLLLTEDDARIVSFLKRGLEAEGYVVDVAGDAATALALARDVDYPLHILDRMLPDADGIEVCRELRRRSGVGLILMLTAKDGLGDKVEGLKGGADDYLTKPFAFDELLARLEALRRRGDRADKGSSRLRVGDLALDPLTRRAWRGRREVVLTAREFALLHYLMTHTSEAVSRARLLSNVWNYDFDPGTKVVDVYIRYLRRKIDEGEAIALIHTVRGFGYRVAAGNGEGGPPAGA